MKLLILGGTGVISSQIVKKALEKGFDVTIFNRGKKASGIDPLVNEIYGDRHNTDDFAEKFKSFSADVVIDMICFDKKDAQQTLEVFGNRAKQIIFTSSIAAYQRPYKSYPMEEDKETLLTCPDFAYGYHKAQMDGYLQSQMSQVPAAITILRPSLTFGDGTANLGILRQNRNLVRRIKQGKPVVMIGEGNIPWSFSFAGDVANAFVLACGNEKTYNECFHVTNTEVVTWESLYLSIGSAVGNQPKMAYIPTVLLKEVYPEVCAHLYHEKVHFSVFSNTKFQKAAPDYQPSITLQEGIRSLVQWWENNDFPFDDAKDELEDNLCEVYDRFRKELMVFKV